MSVVSTAIRGTRRCAPQGSGGVAIVLIAGMQSALDWRTSMTNAYL